MDVPALTRAEIDLNALAHNYRELRRLADPSADIMAVVKADGYGHGALQVARVALDCGARFLAVARLDELNPVDPGLYTTLAEVSADQRQYARAVERDGNPRAQELVREIFMVDHRNWRGIGGTLVRDHGGNCDHKASGVKTRISSQIDNGAGRCLHDATMPEPPDSRRKSA